MKKKQTETDIVGENDLEKDTATVELGAIRLKSHESLWGGALFALMLLFVIASIVAIGWWGYSEWKASRVAQMEPSITTLSDLAREQQNKMLREDTQKQTVSSEEGTTKAALGAAQKLNISVLNGGAAKGSAGVATDFLKAAGYTNLTVGNAIKNYSGVMVYYASGLDTEAATIQTTLVKKYPNVKVLPADASNKETSTAQITIITGK